MLVLGGSIDMVVLGIYMQVVVFQCDLKFVVSQVIVVGL